MSLTRQQKLIGFTVTAVTVGVALLMFNSFWAVFLPAPTFDGLKIWVFLVGAIAISVPQLAFAKRAAKRNLGKFLIVLVGSAGCCGLVFLFLFDGIGALGAKLLPGSMSQRCYLVLKHSPYRYVNLHLRSMNADDFGESYHLFYKSYLVRTPAAQSGGYVLVRGKSSSFGIDVSTIETTPKCPIKGGGVEEDGV